MPCIFKTSISLAASPQVMFRFHSDPNNLMKVMPPTLTLVSLQTDGPAQEGRLIELHCRDWGVLPLRLTCRWNVVQEPHRLEDEMIKGPFVKFVHEHRFEPVENGGCVMTDTVTYQFGHSWWGYLISTLGVRFYLTLLFSFRHYKTRIWAQRFVDAPA
jgi:uncharacterized protein